MLPLPIMAMSAIMAASMHKPHTTSSWMSKHSSDEDEDEDEKEDKEDEYPFEGLTEEEKAIRIRYIRKVRKAAMEVRKRHMHMFLEDHQ
jgi:hypothetical protein